MVFHSYKYLDFSFQVSLVICLPMYHLLVWKRNPLKTTIQYYITTLTTWSKGTGTWQWLVTFPLNVFEDITCYFQMMLWNAVKMDWQLIMAYFLKIIPLPILIVRTQFFSSLQRWNIPWHLSYTMLHRTSVHSVY